jgi:hypothetical protein
MIEARTIEEAHDDSLFVVERSEEEVGMVKG